MGVSLALLLGLAVGCAAAEDSARTAVDQGPADTGVPTDGAAADQGAEADRDLAAVADLADQEGVRDGGDDGDGALDGGDGGDGGPPLTPEQAALAGLPLSGAWPIPGLRRPVQVVRTEAGIPHLYAADIGDLGRAVGFVLARDRYFLLDLQRRLGLGTLSELLGDAALSFDLESRGTGMTLVADRLVAATGGELGDYLAGFAAGINAFQQLATAGELPLPAEIELAGALLGVARPAELMKPFGLRDVAAIAAVVFYNSVFDGEDVARSLSAALLPELFVGAANAELRRVGFLGDVWHEQRTLFACPSTLGFGLSGRDGAAGSHAAPRPGARRPARPPAPRAVPAARAPRPWLQRVAGQLRALQARRGGDGSAGIGSNAWAVAGAATRDGAALLAGDGHLSLSVPSLMYQIGLDTRVYGALDRRQVGLLMSGLPILAVGTNGAVAWSMVKPELDVTDWYLEELQLDAAGRPVATRFGEEWRPLQVVEERYEVADVPLLGSAGRSERIPRYVTFDGRLLTAVEGRELAAGEEPRADEPIVTILGKRMVPSDRDDDGKIQGITLDFAAFDSTGALDALYRFGRAADVEDFRRATRGLVGVGLFLAAADSRGDVLYTSYQGVPCRGYLPRDAPGRWAEGADPTQLLDGTRYRGFTLPTRDGVVDEEPGQTDPYACVIPFADMPQAISPAAGFVVTANNDPGDLQGDGDLFDDRWYLGGPWDGVRAHTIGGALQQAIAAGRADEEEMARIQAIHRSRQGELFAPLLRAAVRRARTLATSLGPVTEAEARLVALYQQRPGALDEVADRLAAWGERGHATPSGVETFYHHPDEGQRGDAVATMIFNAAFPRVLAGVFDDEGIAEAWRFWPAQGRVVVLRRLLEGRGADNPLGLASHDPATGESVFFDRLGSDVVEGSDEILLEALLDALRFLESEPGGPGQGGFGTEVMGDWLWGLRHQTRFRSILASFLGDDPTYELLTQQLSITTARLPLAADLPLGDPRRGLVWFPRGGDQWNVDAANPGFSGIQFTHDIGPVMRMVIALGPEGVRGRNIVPGGQSSRPGDPHFADQAHLWLANETLPLRYTVAEVVAGALSREELRPAP